MTASYDDTSRPAVPAVRTLADLARLAGVSPGTVSRALAGKALVSPGTRERIVALAREHGFRPNQMASRLRSQRTGVIGVVIPLGHAMHQNVSDPFFMTLLGHLADEITQGGLDLMLSRAIPDGTSEWLERMTRSGMVDGVFVIGQSDQMAVIEDVAASYRPLVAWGDTGPGQRHCAVGSDNVAGGHMAASHVIERGARAIAFLGETRGIEIARRLEGAQAAAAEAGLRLVHAPVSLAHQDMGAEVAAALDALDEEVDAFVCASDVIAMTALRLLAERGHSVPADVQVIGFDDIPVAAQTSPPLSTVRQDIAGGARAMFEKLKARIGGEDEPGLVMAPAVIARSSTRAAA